MIQDTKIDIPLTQSKHYLDRDLDPDRNPEDVHIYKGHSLLHTTKGITLLFIVQSLLHCNNGPMQTMVNFCIVGRKVDSTNMHYFNKCIKKCVLVLPKDYGLIIMKFLKCF